MKKRIVSLMLVLCMMAALTACGSTQKADSWEAQLGTSGKLRVGMAADYPPFENYDGNGNVVGLDADVAALIAEDMGLELEIVQMDFETIISAVTSGTVDLGISCFSYNEKRAKSVLFSDTYMTSSQTCIASTQYGIDSLEKLAGGVVGAGSGTTGMDVNLELAEKYGWEARTGEIAIMTEALRSGAMQGVITEQCVAKSYMDANPGDFQIVADDLTVEEIKAVANLGNDALMERVNQSIAKLSENGTLDELVVKWFG